MHHLRHDYQGAVEAIICNLPITSNQHVKSLSGCKPFLAYFVCDCCCYNLSSHQWEFVWWVKFKISKLVNFSLLSSTLWSPHQRAFVLSVGVWSGWLGMVELVGGRRRRESEFGTAFPSCVWSIATLRCWWAVQVSLEVTGWCCHSSSFWIGEELADAVASTA